MLAGGSTGALLRLCVAEHERLRRRRRNQGHNEFFVLMPESLTWLDSASLPMVITAAIVALFTKLASRGGIVSDPDAALGLPLAGCFWIARLGLQGDFPHPSGEHSELKSIPVAIFDA